MFVSILNITKAQTDTQTETDTDTTETETDTEKKEIREPRHEIAIFGAGGMSVINYSLNMNGSKTDGTGGISGHAGISYIWNINPNAGLVTGVEVASYGAKTTYNSISSSKDYGAGFDKFKFTYSINNYIEEQDITLVSIPVMMQYSQYISGSIKFYLLGGLKFGLPVQSEASIFPDVVNTWGDFYVYEKQIYTELPKYGFVSDLRPSPGSITDDIDLTVLVTASLETGARFFLTKNILLYTGAYLDYGLNNIQSTKDKQLVNYQEFNPSTLKYASVLNTSHVNKVKIFGAGLKVKVSFGW
jgi:hypothetical protein